MATRRNRIKAVINVPRGGRPSAHSDRPLTPIPSNLNLQQDSSLSPSPLSPSYHNHPPLSPVKHQPDRGRSPSVYLPPSSSLLRSLSPSPLKLVPSHDYPSLSLVKSPSGSSHGSPGSPRKGDRRPGTPGSSSYGSLHSPPYSGSAYDPRSPGYPFSPPGLQRPSPAQSPSSSFSQQYSTAPLHSGTGAVSRVVSNVTVSSGRERPSPVTSPSFETHRHPMFETHRHNATTMALVAPHSFNTNSNSADSHEVARYMFSSGGGSPAPQTSMMSPQGEQGQRSGTSTPGGGFGGAFSSVVNGKEQQDQLLRQRLQKPSAAITVSKYHTLRKEFMNKVNQTITKEEQGKLSMLHFAFWNPPKNDGGPGSRSRASSVCSDRGHKGGRKSSISDPDLEMNSSHGGGFAAPRRATIDTVNFSSPGSKKDEEEPLSDTESNTSQSSSQTSQSVGPRVKVGPDGQLIIDEQSLVVETSESLRAKKQLSEMETISGADFAVGSSGLFRNKKQIKRGTDWSVKETVKFYKGLSLCGTDFSMMATLFPNRSRAELKSKFKREDRRNPSQISLALSCQEFDPDEGITSDEDEDESAAAINKINRINNEKIRNLTSSGNAEQDKLLREEMEEERTTTFCISAPSSPKRKRKYEKRQPKLEKNENDKIPLKKGRPAAAWKSDLILPTDTDVANVGSSKVKTEKETPSKSKAPKVPKIKVEGAKRKSKKNEKISDKDGIEVINASPSPVSKIQTRRRSWRIAEKDGNGGILEVIESQPDLIPASVVEDCDAMDSLDILRFDPSDPLGLKVVPIKVNANEVGGKAGKMGGELDTEPPSSNDIVTLTNVKLSGRGLADNSFTTREDGSISPRSFVENFDSHNNISSSSLVSRVVKNEQDSLKNKSKKGSQGSKVKVLPYRVPGPGGGPVRSPSLVDEIEIEISCQ